MDLQTPKQNTTSMIRDFFYAEETPWGLAVIRIVLPLILLFVVVPRWNHARELFSADGATAPLAINYGVYNFPPDPTGVAAVAMITALTFCLVAVSIGWHTRFALIASWILFTYLNMLDCLSTFTKYSVISSHVMFLLIFSNCGAIWSVDRWRAQGRGERDLPKSSAWPRRLIQLLVGLIYFGATFTKMHTDGFISGDQIRFWLLTNVNNANPLGEQLAMFPELIVVMSHIGFVWQGLFLFLCWRGRSRLIILGMGTIFHLSTVWLLGLHIFPPIMIVTYFAWLNEGDMQKLRQLCHRLSLDSLTARLKPAAETCGRIARQASPLASIPSAFLFCLALSATVYGGIEIEHRLDPYGRRRPDGPYTLKPISSDRAEVLFRTGVEIGESDKFFAMELGTETLGGFVVGRRDTYCSGDCLIVQCALVPPHEDLQLACSLIDSNGLELYRTEQPVYRTMMRANFPLTLPAQLLPDDYRLVVYSNNELVLSRTIHVTE